MSDNNIEINAKPREGLPITLVGVKYHIKPPKASFAIKLAKQAKAMKQDDPDSAMAVLENWLRQAFTEEDFIGLVGREADEEAGVTEVQGRLNDPDDDLDIEHIAALMEAVTEKQMGGNPTTSRSGTARSRQKTGKR